MAISVDSLTVQQLTTLIARAKERLEAINAEKMAKARDKLAKLAKAEGIELSEILGTRRRRRRTKTAKGRGAPKYRNPKDPAQTWTGKGRRPEWFVKALASGKRESDLQVA